MKLDLKNITKRFPGVTALDDVTISFRGGEIHAICGENGAGKSTLLNIVTGNLQPDQGTLSIDDVEMNFPSPQQAFENGVAIVYQHLSLIDSLTIAENIHASFPPVNKYGFLDRRKLRLDTAKLLRRLGLDYLKPDQLVKSLNAGQKQMVEIAKALSHDPRIVFFDEPTASISEKDAAILFKIIRQLKHAGVTVVYISHRMKEIFLLADLVTVLKDGKTQGTYPISAVNNDKLIKLMVGRDIHLLRKTSSFSNDPLLELDNVSGPGFSGISFRLHKGEILGMAGLVGAGRTEIARAIFGVSKINSGLIKVSGKEVGAFTHPSFAIQNGIAYITEDRRSQGLFLNKTVAENIYVTDIARQSAYEPVRLEAVAASYCKSLEIKTPDIHKKVATLSGGNQQKVLLAKWLHMNTNVLILDEPTHGVDAGAKSEIYKIILGLADKGKAILLISSELPELLHLCHRILVIRKGQRAGIVESDEATEENILSLAM